MGIEAPLGDYDWHAALAALSWQMELGVVDFSVDTPIDRYALPEKLEPIAKPKTAAPAFLDVAKPDTGALAQSAALACPDIESLRAALIGFEHCELKKGARKLVFSDGNPNAPLMVVGEAPGREEDLEGRPFLGPAGQLLDKMLAAIGHSRHAEDVAKSVYITKAVPWRPVNGTPSDDDIALLRPFLMRHIALVKPRAVIAFGNVACTALLGETGITRLRGTWAEAAGVPVMPMAHPSFLLRNPAAKRDAWADLLAVQARLAQ